jgi:hypothetical protein
LIFITRGPSGLPKDLNGSSIHLLLVDLTESHIIAMGNNEENGIELEFRTGLGKVSSPKK